MFDAGSRFHATGTTKSCYFENIQLSSSMILRTVGGLPHPTTRRGDGTRPTPPAEQAEDREFEMGPLPRRKNPLALRLAKLGRAHGANGGTRALTHSAVLSQYSTPRRKTFGPHA